MKRTVLKTNPTRSKSKFTKTLYLMKRLIFLLSRRSENESSEEEGDDSIDEELSEDESDEHDVEEKDADRKRKTSDQSTPHAPREKKAKMNPHPRSSLSDETDAERVSASKTDLLFMQHFSTVNVILVLFQLAIRSELSKMSFEEIQKLKEKIGLKVYNQAIGLAQKQPAEEKNARFHLKEEFKRDNKNRPREMSSKIKVGRHRDVVGLRTGEKHREKRDPRFDSLCGEFDDKIFRDSYKFVDDIKTKEKEQLKKELKETEDPERVAQIKYLIQRMVIPRICFVKVV